MLLLNYYADIQHNSTLANVKLAKQQSSVLRIWMTTGFGLFYLNTTGDGPQNLCSVFFMLSLRVDSSKYQVLWSEAEGPAVGSVNSII